MDGNVLGTLILTADWWRDLRQRHPLLGRALTPEQVTQLDEIAEDYAGDFDLIKHSLNDLVRLTKQRGRDLDALIATSRWLGAQLGKELPGMLARAGDYPAGGAILEPGADQVLRKGST